MKLLVSNYGNTFLTSKSDLKLNIEAVKKFMDNGNKFVIESSKDFKYIKEVIDKNNIPYDYIITQNGFEFYDKNNLENNVFLNQNEKDDIMYFIYSLDLRASIHFKSIYGNNVHIDSNNISDIVAKMSKIRKYSLNNSYKRQFLEEYRSIIINKNKNNLYFSRLQNPLHYINRIQEENNIENDEVYTIGDSINDLDMIRCEDYNGFKIKNSDFRLKARGIKTVENVHSLIKKIDL